MLKKKGRKNTNFNEYLGDLYDPERLRAELDEFYTFTASLHKDVRYLSDERECAEYSCHNSIDSCLDEAREGAEIDLVPSIDGDDEYYDYGYHRMDYREPQQRKTRINQTNILREMDGEIVSTLAPVIAIAKPSNSRSSTRQDESKKILNNNSSPSIETKAWVGSEEEREFPNNTTTVSNELSYSSTCTSNTSLSIVELKAKKRLLEQQQKMGLWKNDCE